MKEWETCRTDQALEDELDAMIKEGKIAEAQRRGAVAFLNSAVVAKDTDFHIKHRLDGYVRFEASGHKYYLRRTEGDLEFPISVSGVWARYFVPCCAEATISQYNDP